MQFRGLDRRVQEKPVSAEKNPDTYGTHGDF